MSVMIRPSDDRRKRDKKITIERLQNWASYNGVHLCPIPKQEGKKTPDYKLFFPREEGIVVAEVKQLELCFNIQGDGVAEIVYSKSKRQNHRPADPIRRKINRAKDQLKPYADQEYKTLLILGCWNQIIEPTLKWNIPIAMQGGGQSIDLLDPSGNLLYKLRSTSKGGTQASGKFNRSISGVGCFYDDDFVFPKKLLVYRHDKPYAEIVGNYAGIDFAK